MTTAVKKYKVYKRVAPDGRVYVGSAERMDNQGMTQKRYCVYLDEPPGKKEWSIDGQ